MDEESLSIRSIDAACILAVMIDVLIENGTLTADDMYIRSCYRQREICKEGISCEGNRNCPQNRQHGVHCRPERAP